MREDNSVDIIFDAKVKWPNEEGVNARDVYLVATTSPGYKNQSTVGVAEQGDFKDESEVVRNKQLWDGGGVRQ